MTSADSAPTEAPQDPGSLWQYRNFMLLWSGQSVSLVGTAVTTLVLPLVALRAFGASAFEVGALAMVGGLPSILIGLPAGPLVDRWRARPTMLWCDVGRALALGSIPIAYSIGALTIVQLFVVAFVSGTLSVFFDVAYQGYLPSIVARKQLMDGNGKLGTSNAFALLVGPSLGGILVALIGAARAVSADALSYVISAASLVLIRVEEPPRRRAARSVKVMWAEIVEGLRYVLGDDLMRPITLSNSSGSFFLAGLNAIWLVYAVRNLHWQPQPIGIVLGVGALGGLVGGVISNSLVERFGVPRVMLVARIAIAPAELLIPLAPRGLGGQFVVATSFVLVLLAGVIFTTTQRTFRQLICPAPMLSRMNASTRWLQWSLRPLGAVVGGAVGSLFGLRLALFAGVARLFISAAALYFRTPLRHMPDLPQPVAEAAAAGSSQH